VVILNALLSGGMAAHDNGWPPRRLRAGTRCWIGAAPEAAGSARRNAESNGSLMSPQTQAERELADLLVESLNLEDVEPGSIDPEAPLFNSGLGLDSIDALELALAISKRYGFQLRSDNDENSNIFASLRALSAHVEQNKAA
jgi:acyl carrier protein